MINSLNIGVKYVYFSVELTADNIYLGNSKGGSQRPLLLLPAVNIGPAILESSSVHRPDNYGHTICNAPHLRSPETCWRADLLPVEMLFERMLHPFPTDLYFPRQLKPASMYIPYDINMSLFVFCQNVLNWARLIVMDGLASFETHNDKHIFSRWNHIVGRWKSVLVDMVFYWNSDLVYI